MAGDEEINQQYDKMTPMVDEGSEIRRETNCMDEEGSQRWENTQHEVESEWIE